MDKNYLLRWFHLLVFLTIWLGLPYLLVKNTGTDGWWMLIFLSWIPALMVVQYLEDED